MAHLTNRQLSQVYTLAPGVETYVAGCVDGLPADFVLNGGTNGTLNFDLTKIGVAVTTVRVYTKVSPLDAPCLLGSFTLNPGLPSVTTFQSFGPIAAWAVRITAELAAGGVIDVGARVET